jgi:hypothetical protein
MIELEIWHETPAGWDDFVMQCEVRHFEQLASWKPRMGGI